MNIRGTTQQIKEVHTIIRMNIFRAHTFSIRLSVDIGDQIRAPVYTSPFPPSFPHCFFVEQTSSYMYIYM